MPPPCRYTSIMHRTCRWFLLLAGFFCLCGPVRAAEKPLIPRPAPTGALWHAPIELTDPRRHSTLAVQVVLPPGNGPFPVIIYSHGVGGGEETPPPIVRAWADQGYACLMPIHADSFLRQHKTPNRLDWVILVQQILRDPAAWENRALDIHLLLDSTEELYRQQPQLRGKLDFKRLGLAGHSFGAFTTQAIGGARIDLPGRLATTFEDPRPLAFILLAPQGIGQMGLSGTSWDKFRRPLLSVVGSQDIGARSQRATWRKDAFVHAPAGDKYLLWLQGADHMSYTGHYLSKRKMRDDQEIFEVVKTTTTLFWNAYLQNSPKDRQQLNREYRDKRSELSRK